MAQKFTVPITVKQLSTSGSDAITIYVDADTYARLKVEAGGRLTWGSGSGAGDVNLYRDGADVLKTDDKFIAGKELVSAHSSGDEGGEIQLAIPQTNTTIATGVAIDVYQNKLRIYETGGSNRGAYIDLTAASNGVASNLLGGGGGASVTVSDTPPSSPTSGDMWFESDTGRVFVYYDSFWVETTSTSPSNKNVVTSTTRPSSPYEGQLIYETDTNRVLVYDNSAWVMIADTDQPPGLQLIKSQTVGTAVSSVTVSDCFSEDFDNYRIVFSGIDCSDGAYSWYIQFGSATTNYYGSKYYDSYAGSNTNTLRSNAGSGVYVGVQDVDNTSATIDVCRPYASTVTTFHGTYYGGGFSGWSAGIHAANTSHTSFKMTLGFGTMTGGKIRVYGYRDS